MKHIRIKDARYKGSDSIAYLRLKKMKIDIPATFKTHLLLENILNDFYGKEGEEYESLHYYLNHFIDEKINPSLKLCYAISKELVYHIHDSDEGLVDKIEIDDLSLTFSSILHLIALCYGGGHLAKKYLLLRELQKKRVME